MWTLPPPRIPVGYPVGLPAGEEMGGGESQALVVNCLHLHSSSVKPETTSSTLLVYFNLPKLYEQVEFIVSSYK